MTTTAGKVWGNTQKIFARNNVEFHRIFVKEGGYCSNHCHKHKHNGFWVERGALSVEVAKNDYGLVDVTLLMAGDYMEVAPGEFHRFKALQDTVAYEIYFVELDANDIVREDHGGVKT